MASRKLPPIVPEPPSSWMDLLAATTLPDARTHTVHAVVSGEISERGELRLVVQSFDDGSTRPVGSIQRAVTAADLRKGVALPIVEIRGKASAWGAPRVRAWVERGRPDLEFDGRTARPGPGAWVGEARGSDVDVVLRPNVSRAA